MPTITVIKRNLEGEETWRYSGEVLERSADRVRLEALFNRNDVPFQGIILRRGDRFVETFYSDRWYNVFEIHDRDDDHLKGWYCNIGYPAEISDHQVSYIDLALDLLVYPDGAQLVLDEDEFAEMPLDATARQQARAALEDLRRRFADKTAPQSGLD